VAGGCADLGAIEPADPGTDQWFEDLAVDPVSEGANGIETVFRGVG
jgi:hypothetical protein